MYKVIPFFFHFTFPSTNFRNRTYWIQPPESNAQHIYLQSWTMGASENIHVNWPYWSFWKCSGCWCCEYSSSFLVQFKCFVVNCYVQGSISPFFSPYFFFPPFNWQPQFAGIFKKPPHLLSVEKKLSKAQQALASRLQVPPPEVRTLVLLSSSPMPFKFVY